MYLRCLLAVIPGLIAYIPFIVLLPFMNKTHEAQRYGLTEKICIAKNLLQI